MMTHWAPSEGFQSWVMCSGSDGGEEDRSWNPVWRVVGLGFDLGRGGIRHYPKDFYRIQRFL